MRTTAEETQRNNRLILDTAIEIFSKNSYDSVNMQDIADAAGISRGPLYYRYRTKAELFSAAYCEYMDRLVAEYRRIFSQDKPVLEMFREDLKFCTSSAQMEGMAGWNTKAVQVDYAGLKIKSLKYEQEVYALKEDAVIKAVGNGELRADIDVKHLVNMVFIFAEGIFVMVHYRNYQIERGEIEESIEDMIDLLKMKYGA